jgi:hypothetical protein
MDYYVGEMLRIAPSGEVTSLGRLASRPENMVGLAQDPDTAEYVMTVNFTRSLIHVNASAYMVAVLAETSKEPAPYTACLLVRPNNSSALCNAFSSASSRVAPLVRHRAAPGDTLSALQCHSAPRR